jgi:hypothetical protein
MNQDLIGTIRNSLKQGSSQQKVFILLSDKQWHCRSCEGKKVASGQYAGGGGIQGLQRGTKSRYGLVIETKRDICAICTEKTTWDRWTGNVQASNASANIPNELARKILNFYKFKDVIENRIRQSHELVIDHRFPMERWGESEESHEINMTEADIKRKFQLLKKDAAGNHNLLKSRSCERCIKTGKRGTPMGIHFWYSGEEEWDEKIPDKGAEAEQGCVGCGWYDFEQWRNALNNILDELQQITSDLPDSINSK